MKFLFFLNVSNQENLSCDSGVIFHELLFSPLVQKGHDISIVAPSFTEKKSVKLIKYSFGSNKYEVRFSFNWDKVKEIIDIEQPDIVWVNQIELLSSFRALIETEGYECKLVSYCHYLPFFFDEKGLHEDASLSQFGLLRPILHRLLEAMVLSDKVFIQSAFAKNQVIQLSEYFNYQVDDSNIVVLPPPADPFLLEKKLKIDHTHKEKTILYNHRLYSQYGTDEIIQLFSDCKKKGKDFSFVVTDMMNKRSKKRDLLDGSVSSAKKRLQELSNVTLTDKGSIRIGYKKLLSETSLALAAPRRACVWSMSVIDCLGMGVPVLAPNYAFYPELLPKEMLYTTREDLSNKIEQFFVEDRQQLKLRKQAISLVGEYLPEKIVNRLLNELSYD